jgi:hypothetical protein
MTDGGRQLKARSLSNRLSVTLEYNGEPDGLTAFAVQSIKITEKEYQELMTQLQVLKSAEESEKYTNRTKAGSQRVVAALRRDHQQLHEPGIRGTIL